jgi:hypothetical protein
MLLAASSPERAVTVARLARVLRAAPAAIAGALGLPLADTEASAEVSHTDGAGGVVVLWDGPVSDIMSDASGVAEYTITGTGYVSARPVSTLGDLDDLASSLLISLLALRAQGVSSVAGDEARLSFAAPSLFFPVGEGRDTVRLQIPLALTIRLQVLALPEDATLTETYSTLISPFDLRRR